MKTMCALALLVGASACSGGGNTSTPTPSPTSPANTAPKFTSSTTATVEENAQLQYRPAATDAEGDSIQYAVSGGADASKFRIAGNGALEFSTLPDYDTADDVDSNNVYLVQLSASDGRATSTLDLAVTVTNSREGIAVRRVATGFNQPIYVAPFGTTDKLLVAEKTGRIYLLDPATGQRSLFTAIDNISTDGERGLLSVVIDQRFPSSLANPSLFLALVTARDGAIELRQYQNDSFGGFFYNVTFSIPHPGASNHNGGWLGFDASGKLYVTVGDGGTGGDPAQNPNSKLGKVLRLVPNDPNAGASVFYNYVPDPTNPYSSGGGDPYVYAMGLRNPFRASITGNTLVIGDVGENRIEEIDLLPLQVTPTKGTPINYGWPFMEGTQPFKGSATGLTAPVSEYAHGVGPREGASIIGGYNYAGRASMLRGAYVFGDFVSGNIWSVPNLSGQTSQPVPRYARRNEDFTPNVGTIDQLVSFGEDATHNLYIVDFDGDIFVIDGS